MARFFFHTESEYRHTDSEGAELNDVEAARCEGARLAGEILRDGARKFWGTKPWTLTVTDVEGLIFFTVVLHGQDTPAATHH
jgi:hypothetical protein